MQLIPIQLLMAPTFPPDGLGYDMVHASLILAPSGLVMFAMSNVSGRMNAALGARVSLALGVVIGIGYHVIVGVAGPWGISWIHMLVLSCCIGAGLGIAYSAMPALIMQVVSVEQTGESNGVNALMRIIGTSTASAVVGMLLTWSMTSFTGPDGASSRGPHHRRVPLGVGDRPRRVCGRGAGRLRHPGAQGHHGPPSAARDAGWGARSIRTSGFVTRDAHGVRARSAWPPRS